MEQLWPQGARLINVHDDGGFLTIDVRGTDATSEADNVFGVDDGIRSQHSGNGLKRWEIHPVSRCTLVIERNLSDKLRFNQLAGTSLLGFGTALYSYF
jgi:hypothetical protein